MNDMLKEFRRCQNLEGNEAVRCSRMHFKQWADELESLTARLAAAEALWETAVQFEGQDWADHIAQSLEAEKAGLQ